LAEPVAQLDADEGVDADGGEGHVEAQLLIGAHHEVEEGGADLGGGGGVVGEDSGERAQLGRNSLSAPLVPTAAVPGVSPPCC